ncbi:hypothetical protein BT93_K0757 [Corymbia citriodora subsp. variegata]|nr:hypothetical protein BT93_K0757 [Corymbia citriodora subsp. variegata]
MSKSEKCEKRSSGVCGKIFGGICHKSRGGQVPNHAQLEADPSIKDLEIQSNPGGHQVTVVIENGKGKSSTSDSGANKPKSESTLNVDQESKRSEHDVDNRSSNYINRTWLKIRAMSNVGRGKDHSSTKDVRHDQFADYIAKAKKKFTRALTNHGWWWWRWFSLEVKS